MAFGDIVGEAFGFNDKKGWTLEGNDPGFEGVKFSGQFMPEGFSEGGGGMNLGETSTVNKDQPNQQYLGGESQFASFKTRLYADDSFKNISQQVNNLKGLKKRNSDLRRPPIFLFTYGTEIAFTCFVKQVDIQYDELRSDGSIRGVVANIQLQIVEDIIVQAAATSMAALIKFAAGVIAGSAGIVATLKNKITIPGFSVHTISRKILAKEGDTFESIAAKEYGSAIQGDLLRVTQPEKVRLEPGDEVILLDPTEINEIPVTQRSTALKNTPENLALREAFLSRTPRTTTVFI